MPSLGKFPRRDEAPAFYPTAMVGHHAAARHHLPPPSGPSPYSPGHSSSSYTQLPPPPPPLLPPPMHHSPVKMEGGSHHHQHHHHHHQHSTITPSANLPPGSGRGRGRGRIPHDVTEVKEMISPSGAVIGKVHFTREDLEIERQEPIRVEGQDAAVICPYPECGKRFPKNRTYNLKAHLRSHSQVKPFQCGYCNRAFSRKHDLERHSRTHVSSIPSLTHTFLTQQQILTKPLSLHVIVCRRKKDPTSATHAAKFSRALMRSGDIGR